MVKNVVQCWQLIIISFTHTHTHTHTLQPRNDGHFDPSDNLSSCLKVQPLSCTPASTSSSTKPSKPDSSSKSSKLKPIKSEKSSRVPSIAVHHLPFMNEPHCPPQLMPTLSEAPTDYYHTYAAIPSHRGNLAPLSPGSGGLLHSPPSMISPTQAPPHSGSVQGYQLQSPKMAQLSPGSAAFPSNQASSNPTPSTIYTSDPTSPMQVTTAYSPPSQPLMQMTSSADNLVYHHNGLMNGSNSNGHNVVSVPFTAACQTANIGLHHPQHHPPHFLPPPNYTEAVALNNGIPPQTQTLEHLPTHGYYPTVTTCTIGARGEYHHTANGTLPTGMLGLTGNHFWLIDYDNY